MIKKNIIINNLNIIYYISDSFDSGNALIFLHGWQSSSLLFKDVLKRSKNYIALELPGFNGSEISEKSWTLDDFAIFLDEFLKKLNIKNPTLIGHSFGGNLILKYLINGSPAKKAVLIDASGVRQKTARVKAYYFASKLIKVLYIIPGLKVLIEKNKRHFYKMIKSEDYVNSGKLKGTYQNIINEDLTNELNKINIGVYIIWGDSDDEAPVFQAKILNEKIKGSKLYIIENTGHFVFLDDPTEFNKIFFEILKC
jgi:pimeloyl-ACP methyl ester carboxylesterase